MASVTEQLDKAKKRRTGNQNRKKNPSGHGKGKWETLSSLGKYRIRRNKANRVASESRRRNR
jgi:ribosomal protein S4